MKRAKFPAIAGVTVAVLMISMALTAWVVIAAEVTARPRLLIMAANMVAVSIVALILLRDRMRASLASAGFGMDTQAVAGSPTTPTGSTASDAELVEMNQLVRQALDCASVPVRIVDRNGKILFLSKTLQRKIAELEPEIRKRIPGFDKDKLMGGSIGIFYPNPQEALARLGSLDSERRSRLEIGGRDFDIVTNPVRNAAGQIVGSVGEWVDRHEELAAEKRLSELIDAASRGDFSGRVDLRGLSGFHLEAGQGINRMMDQVSATLDELAQVLGAISSGDLSREMSGQFDGIFSRLQATTNGTISTMAGTIGDIRAAAQSVSGVARDISQGNADLSSHNRQQTTSLETTSGNMRELIEMVTHTAENSRTANKLASEASLLASEGGVTVGRVVQTMDDIGQASRKVEEIISVIDGIAFQTNILALNAAVEAARAGEHGLGFAVVATEVRTLAQRSAEAAREIKNLITTATSRVDSGAQLVKSAGDQMGKIVAAIKRTTDLISEIAESATQQHQGIQRIGDEVRNMDEMNKSNSILVEAATAATQSLDEHSERLAERMNAFRLNRTRAGAHSLNAA